MSQGLNIWLTLKLKVNLLETERDILGQVAGQFVRIQVCDERHDGHKAPRHRGHRLEPVDPV